MKPSNNASKLILSTALFTLAGSIVFVSGTGLAQGATSTDKAISTLKSQIKSLQTRVQTLENTQIRGADGEIGRLNKKELTVWKKESGSSCFLGLSQDFVALDPATETEKDLNSNNIELSKSCSKLKATKITVYGP